MSMMQRMVRLAALAFLGTNTLWAQEEITIAPQDTANYVMPEVVVVGEAENLNICSLPLPATTGVDSTRCWKRYTWPSSSPILPTP